MTHSTPAQHQTGLSLIRRLTDLGKRLTEPAVAVPARDHNKVRLLSYLLLLFIPLSAVAFGLTLLDERGAARSGTTPLLFLILIAVLLLAVAYALSRTKYYGLASMLVVGTIIGAIFASAWLKTDAIDLHYFAIGILLSSLFHSWRGTLPWLMVILVGMILLSLSVPVITLDLIIDGLYIVITIGALAMLYAAVQQRNLTLIEERTSTLAASEQALRQARDELECVYKNAPPNWETPICGYRPRLPFWSNAAVIQRC